MLWLALGCMIFTEVLCGKTPFIIAGMGKLVSKVFQFLLPGPGCSAAPVFLHPHDNLSLQGTPQVPLLSRSPSIPLQPLSVNASTPQTPALSAGVPPCASPPLPGQRLCEVATPLGRIQLQMTAPSTVPMAASSSSPPVCIGMHYVALISDQRVVVKALSLGATPNTVTVLPCKPSLLGTFRQASPSEMLHIAAESLQLGPFALSVGRPPAFVHQHLQQAPWWPPRRVPTSQPQSAPGPMPLSPGKLAPRFQFPSRLQALVDLGFKSERTQLRDLLTEHQGDMWAAFDEFLRRREHCKETPQACAPLGSTESPFLFG